MKARSGLLFGLLALIVGLILLATAIYDLRANGTLTVSAAWARPAGQGTTGAVYLTLDNGTGINQQLTSAATSLADSVELHQSTIDANNVARMRPVDQLDLPPGSIIQIAPGGYHLMLINLRQALKAGDRFPITLTFASGQKLTVEVLVQDAPPR